jgi:NAD(P)-dependent dehydrogenase (short-subunit alcohol dehydrogenase family)
MSRQRFEGRQVVITGGSGGLGSAAARAFLAEGAHVHLIDRDGPRLEATIAGLQGGGQCTAWTADVANEAEIEAAFDGIAANGPVDVLVNSAGIAIRRPAVDLSLEDWSTVVAVNQTALFLCSRAAARRMGREGDRSIVNLASIMGLSGGGIYPNLSYQATKGAVVNMTRALAIEWAPLGIRVNAVAPTWVRTALTEGLFSNPAVHERMLAMTPLGRLPEAEDVAAAIVFLASTDARFITGHTLPVDAGYLAQ